MGDDVGFGNRGDDHLSDRPTSLGDDRYSGGRDEDFLDGDGGDDTLFGGPDVDEIRGGFGIDTCRSPSNPPRALGC
ncbi:MAG TPA: hypothetical protein VF423_02295 [Actinomycetes bacterium]